MADGVTKSMVNTTLMIAASEGGNSSGRDMTTMVKIIIKHGVRFLKNTQAQLLETCPQNLRDRSKRSNLLSINSSSLSSASNASP